MSASLPALSVVIAAYNHGPYLCAALDSVFAQEGWNVQVVVVDDGSTDNTPDVARVYADRVEYTRIQNSGVAVARNVGLERAQGELVCFLDADDVWFPDKLTAQWEALQRYPGAGLVYSDAVRIHHDGRFIDHYSDLIPQHAGWVFPRIMERNFVQTSMVMVPRLVLDRVGWFDASLPAWEDIDLWCRIAAAYPFAYVPRPLEYYRMHGGFHAATIRQAHGRMQSIVKILDDAPSSALSLRQRRLIIARGLVDLGLACYLTSDMAEARRYLRLALSVMPGAWRLEHWLGIYLRSLLGQRAVERLRSVARSRLLAVGR